MLFPHECPDSTTWCQSEGMAKRGKLFEQRYYYQEPGKSDRALLRPAMSNVGSSGLSKAADTQVE